MMEPDRHKRMRSSLDGLSVGDAFGLQFTYHMEDIGRKRADVPPWHWTDDTEMALSVVRVLQVHGKIDQDELAKSFLNHFDSNRGYGPAMVFDYFHRLKEGQNWKIAATSLFDGSGSFGNGAAMRVAPLGAFFADDLDRVVVEARKSAEVTHTHHEGIAGAIAVAIATAIACRHDIADEIPGPRGYLKAISEYIPESEVERQIKMASEEFGPGVSSEKAARILGNGDHVTAQDTVPFCLWVVGRFLDDYEQALWETVRVLGDMDTNCAIVGGIIGGRVGRNAIPSTWLEYREELPSWPFR